MENVTVLKSSHLCRFQDFIRDMVVLANIFQDMDTYTHILSWSIFNHSLGHISK